MFSIFQSTQSKHSKLHKKGLENPLGTYLQTPLADKKIDYLDAEYLAVDFETTGLDPRQDSIVSIGYVPIRNGRIILKEAKEEIIKSSAPLKAESITIHGITHQDVERSGQAQTEVIERLLQVLAGKVMLVHYARIEETFLNELCNKLYNHSLPVHIADTLELEKTSLENRAIPINQNALRLGNCRERYNLPRYPAHTALSDAISTAELFFAIARHKQGSAKHYSLKHFLL